MRKRVYDVIAGGVAVVLNVANGDRHLSCGVYLAVDANDSGHVMRAKVARALFRLQQPHPHLAMAEVADGVGIQSLVAQRPFADGELRDDVRVGDREYQHASFLDLGH